MLRDLLDALFGIFTGNGRKPNSYVMRAVMRVLSTAKETIAPHVPMVLEQISALLRTVIQNPQSPVFNHYLFESIGVLLLCFFFFPPPPHSSRCTGALIGCASAAGGSQAVASLQQALLPMFQSILQQDLAEFSSYVFQLMGQLLAAHKEGVPDVFWDMYPSLMVPLQWSRPGNVPALVKLLNQYLAKGASKIVSNEQSMTSLLGVWQQLNSTVKHDAETFELLNGLTDALPLPALDKYVARLLQLIFLRLTNPKAKTPRYVTGFVTWLLSFAARHGMSASFCSLFDSRFALSQAARPSLCVATVCSPAFGSTALGLWCSTSISRVRWATRSDARWALSRYGFRACFSASLTRWNPIAADADGGNARARLRPIVGSIADCAHGCLRASRGRGGCCGRRHCRRGD